MNRARLIHVFPGTIHRVRRFGLEEGPPCCWRMNYRCDGHEEDTESYVTVRPTAPLDRSGRRVIDARWAGIPEGGFPGFDLTFGAGFWALLPVFVVITLVGGIKNTGDSVAIQHASRRRRKVTDFRSVQGSLNTNGIGILLSGIFGTPPHNRLFAHQRVAHQSDGCRPSATSDT